MSLPHANDAGLPASEEICLHIGRKLRRRRRLLGLTQQKLADLIGVRFQQIQKYECGANRVTASRLFALSNALTVPIGYFFAGLPGARRERDFAQDADEQEAGLSELWTRKETIELVRAFYALKEAPRRRLLALAKALQDESSAVA